jgi:hypothetical protein
LIEAAIRFAKASATNQIARFAPAFYVKLTGQTGRGEAGLESANGIAEYFTRCFEDYFKTLAIPRDAVSQWLSEKIILEYGPGDLPGVALLLVAHGAKKVFCVDRFPLMTLSEKNAQALQILLDSLTPQQRARAASCLRDAGNPQRGFNEQRIEYLIRDSGLSGFSAQVDLAISRAVLEHVNDLDATFHDMDAALRPSALTIHQVDLSSHGLHRRNPLDFLTWSPWAWHCMFSHKGVPNRWRVNRYREAIAKTRLRMLQLEPTRQAKPSDIEDVRPTLAAPFRGLSDQDLSWLGFWFVCEKEAAKA